MWIQVDEWEMAEAGALREVAAEYTRLVHQLEGTLSGLRNINNDVCNGQVSGPPSDFFKNLWDEWDGQTNPLLPRLYNLINDLIRQAGQWESSYQSQKRAADAQNRRLAEEITRSKNTTN